MYKIPKDARESHFAANGQRVGINDDFIVGGKRVSGPRQFNDPSEDAYCGCGIQIEVF